MLRRRMALIWRDVLILATVITMTKTCWGQMKPVVINEMITYFDVTSVKDITWEVASKRCISLGMSLCIKKDLCLSSPVAPRNFIKQPNNKYVPVGDAYNDWVYLGPRKKNRCQRMTEVSGPPVWKGKGCKDAVGTSKVFQRFCQSSSGIYCCQRPNKMADLVSHPVTVYISRYEQNNQEIYSFSLKDRTSSGSQAVSKNLKKLTLMSDKVDGKFEDPIYFCSRQINMAKGKVVEYFYVSNKWCNWGWKMNFYLFGSFVQLPEAQRYEANAIGFGKKLQTKVTVNGTILGSSYDFAFYGPKFSDGTHIEFISQISSKTICSDKTVLLTSGRGTINSKDFDISKNLTCRWKIRAPSNGIVKITFLRMKLMTKNGSTTSKAATETLRTQYADYRIRRYDSNFDCSEEKLEVFGYGRFCGNSLPSSFVTIDNEIDISFVRKMESDRGQSKSEFVLSYEAIIAPSGLVRKRLYDPSLTWNDANEMCSNSGKSLCKANDICEHTSGRPFYGVQEYDQWTPIMDEFNDWLQIGRGNVRTCKTHNDMFGPPLWGISRTECNSSNEYLPCPKRDYLYCCDRITSTPEQAEELVDVLIYSRVYQRVIFSKYVRRGIDSQTSFDDMKLRWTNTKKSSRDYSTIKLSSKYTTKFNKPLYFCQREVVPAIQQLRFAYSMLSEPCESRGWKYLYHLYGMSRSHPTTVGYYVGVYEKRPYHTRIRAGNFPLNFRKESSFIVYSYGARVPPSKQSPVSKACDGSVIIVTAPTAIMSPGYPKSYQPRSDCRWIIKKPNGGNKDDMLRLTVKELDLEDPVDVLTVQTVPDSSSSSNHAAKGQVRTLSGIVGQLTIKTNGHFELNFTSDETISRKGFKIEVDIIGNKCDGEVRTNGDLITSPNYPSRYPAKVKCQWSIEAPSQNYDIKFKVSFLDLRNEENCTDKIVITSPNATTTLCGRDMPSDDILVNSSAAVVQFHSSTPIAKSAKRGKGFALQVIFVERPSPKMLRCGVQSIPFGSTDPVSEKIVGGTTAMIQNFPWMMHIVSNATYCAGTLISKSWVLSAGHCLMRTRTMPSGRVIGYLRDNPATMRLIAGRQKLNVSNPGEQVRRVLHVQLRDDFLEPLYVQIVNGRLKISTFTINDVVLLKMDKELIFTPSVQPICLPDQDARVGDTCYIAGWGEIDEEGTDTVDLRYTKAPILPTEHCNKYSGMQDTITDSGLCAGYPAGGSGMCNGDSGGPLFCRGKYGNYYVNGITSWSVGCARKDQPGVYTRIYHYSEWIKKVIESDLPKSDDEDVSINITQT